MPEDNGTEEPILKISLFPVIWISIAGVCISILTYYRKGSFILSSLRGLTFTMSLFLVLIIIFYKINRYIELSNKKWQIRITAFLKKIFNKHKINEASKKENPQEIEKTDMPGEGQNGPEGLIEIQKKNVSQPRQTQPGPEKRVCGMLYLIAFVCLAFWRISGIVKVMPLSFVGHYRRSIADAVLLFVFPCVSVFYLKIKKDNSAPIEQFFRDVLTLFSYVYVIYAAVIAAASVLNLNIPVVLPWVYYAVSVYLVVSLALNITISILKGDIFSFAYRLFPKIARARDKTDEYTGSKTAPWKVSLKSLYTIRYTITILPGLALALLVVLFISTAVFVVQPYQQAAVYHFGKLNRSSIKNGGVHFKLPWPVDKTEIYDVHRAASMQIGYESSGGANFLWTQMHDGGEYMLLLGNGNEMAAVNIKIMYVVSDLYSYIKTCTKPELVLAAAVYNALMRRTVNTTLDSFLSVDRNSLSASVLDELSQFYTSENLGFSVVQVIIESIHPPVDIADVYQKVVSASVDKTAAITKAQTYAEIKITEARKQSRSAIDHAKAMQYSRTSDAQKETAVIYAAMEAYRISPGSFELTRYLDVYEKIINGNKVYVFSPGAQGSISKFVIGKINTLNLTDTTGAGNE